MEHIASKSNLTLDTLVLGQLDDDTADRRMRCMDAAKRLMAKNGFERTSVSEISREAHVSQTDVLRLFKNKPGLLEALFNAFWEPLNNRIADIVMAAVNVRQALIAILGAMLKVMSRDQDLTKLLLFESRRQHGDNCDIRLSKGFHDFEDLLLHIFERGQRDGSFNPTLPARAMTSALLGAAEGMLRDRVLAVMQGRPEPFDEAELQRAFEAIVNRLAV